MTLTLTPSQMLELWMTHRGFLTSLPSATLTRTDLPDLHADEYRRLQAWYADLLDNAPPSLLAPVDILPLLIADGEGRYRLPQGTRRLIGATAGTPPHPIAVRVAGTPEARMLRNPFARRVPAVTHCGTHILVTPPDLALASLTAVRELADTFTFDTSAINTIPQ